MTSASRRDYLARSRGGPHRAQQELKAGADGPQKTKWRAGVPVTSPAWIVPIQS